MEHYPSGLKNLFDSSEEAKAYFQSLPPDVRTALCRQRITNLEELKTQAEHIIKTAF